MEGEMVQNCVFSSKTLKYLCGPWVMSVCEHTSVCATSTLKMDPRPRTSVSFSPPHPSGRALSRLVRTSHCLVVGSFGGRDSGSACSPLSGLYSTACRNSQRETLCSALYLVLQKILVRTFYQRGLTFCDVVRSFEGKRAFFQKKTRSLRSETLPTKSVPN